MSQQSAEKKGGKLVIATNRTARHSYSILDSWEVGLSLLGSEVKSIRLGNVNLKESYVDLQSGEAILLGCHVKPYEFSGANAVDPLRPKKLLLKKREIELIASRRQREGLAVIPLELYFVSGKCKILIALGKGKKAPDKRDDIKKREADREIRRIVKNNQRK